MSLTTIEPKNAEQLYNRLTRMEKIHLRDATDGRLEYLAQEEYKVDGATLEVMLEVRDRLNQEFAEFNASSYWDLK